MNVMTQNIEALRRLKGSLSNPDDADPIATFFASAIDTSAATKHDLNEGLAGLAARMDRLDAKVDLNYQSLDTKVDRLSNRLEAKLDLMAMQTRNYILGGALAGIFTIVATALSILRFIKPV